MRKYLVVTMVLCAVMMLVSIASAANLMIYNGKATSSQLGSWGNGKLAVSTEVKKGTVSALEITTRGYSEGGYFSLTPTVDLSDYFTAPTKSFLNLQVKIPAQSTGSSRRGAIPDANDWQANYAQMMGGPGMMMGGPGMMGGNMTGRGGRSGRSQTVTRTLDAVRVLLITDKGQLDAGSFKMENLKKTDDWAEISVPLSALKGKGGGSGVKLEGVVFTGNGDGKFYVAKIELVKQ